MLMVLLFLLYPLCIWQAIELVEKEEGEGGEIAQKRMLVYFFMGKAYMRSQEPDYAAEVFQRFLDTLGELGGSQGRREQEMGATCHAMIPDFHAINQEYSCLPFSHLLPPLPTQP